MSRNIFEIVQSMDKQDIGIRLAFKARLSPAMGAAVPEEAVKESFVGEVEGVAEGRA